MISRVKKKGIIKKISIYTISAFITYNLICLAFPYERENTFTNMERAEEFVYSRKHYPVVFLGSGLIGNFSKELVGRSNCFNLFFPFNGSCTGVEIVAKSNKVPDTIFIETNYIYKGFDNQILNHLFTPPIYDLRFIFPILQLKYRPLTLFKEKLKEIFKTAKHKQISPEPISDSLFSLSLQRYKVAYSVLADTVRIFKSIEKLKCYTDYLMSKGCIIYFFEMPVNEEIRNSPLCIYQREALKKQFCKDNVKWLGTDTSGTYYTHDGVHLLEKSVYTYLEHFNKNISTSH